MYYAITFTDLNGDKQWQVVQADTQPKAQGIVTRDPELECKRIDFVFESATPITGKPVL